MEIIIKLKEKKIILKQKFFENLGVIFGILSKKDNKVSISNRIYEQYILWL